MQEGNAKIAKNILETVCRRVEHIDIFAVLLYNENTNTAMGDVV